MVDSSLVQSAPVATGVKLIGLPDALIACLGAVDARLDVELARRGDEADHVAAGRSSEAIRWPSCVAGGRRGPARCRRAGWCRGRPWRRRRCRRPPGCRRPGPCRPARGRPSCRRPPRAMPSAFAEIAVFSGVDHLRRRRSLGAGPLEVAAEQRAGVVGAVLGRGEERVGRHVVDEDELPFRRRRERARSALGRAGRGVLFVAGGAGGEQRRGRRGGADHARAAEEPPSCRALEAERVDGLFDLGMDLGHHEPPEQWAEVRATDLVARPPPAPDPGGCSIFRMAFEVSVETVSSGGMPVKR